MSKNVYDILVVGAGAAGLNTALVSARARRRVAVVDTGKPRNAPSPHMHGMLTRDGESPQALLKMGREEVANYGVDLFEGEVTEIRSGFWAHLTDGTMLRARRIVVATGLRDELPDIPGIRERWGRDVVFCPYCHGYEIRDQPIGVLGTHPSAVNHALLLRQWSSDIVFMPHTLEMTDDDQERLAARGIPVVEGVIDHMVVDGDQLRGVELAGHHAVPCRTVFIFPHMVPHDTLLTDLGCERSDHGWVVTDSMGKTSVPGVWAAGNVVDPRAQVPTAAGMGAATAFALNHELVDEEVDLAVQDYLAAKP